ncbi:sulfatase-like hydrolase/transferase [Urbifossiella limnaea]|uniref:Sulfatase n=1 Tax=Urbifossiella limnaea TaxID=2528023 RepID=A0A517XU92_9BACT|nr:sulfatase-like hydrolase/transferase [Urbifossiella limnaea]QDU21078.1 Sulfatase [Urbifossiella limnaea]
MRWVLAATAAVAVVAPAAAQAARPNVVIVMTDDQGLGDFSYTGNPVLRTPAFDAFARESVRPGHSR